MKNISIALRRIQSRPHPAASGHPDRAGQSDLVQRSVARRPSPARRSTSSTSSSAPLHLPKHLLRAPQHRTTPNDRFNPLPSFLKKGADRHQGYPMGMRGMIRLAHRATAGRLFTPIMRGGWAIRYRIEQDQTLRPARAQRDRKVGC